MDVLARSETAAPSTAVGVYDSHGEAERAARTLARSGFDIQKLSAVGRDYATEEGVVGFYNAGDRMKAWVRTSAFSGGLGGLLFGLVRKRPLERAHADWRVG